MSNAVENVDVPRFSIAERDRRWARVRKLMERDGLDVIVAPSNTGSWDQLQSNVRYLTSMGGNCAPVAAVFPREGEVTAIVPPIPAKDHWLGRQDWLTDIRLNFFALGDALAARVKELPQKSKRIGIAGLANVMRMPEGLVSHGTFEKIKEAFPEAELVDCTYLMDEARFVKSADEIEFLRKGTELVEQAISVLEAEARDGVPECAVYGKMIGKMCELGGDLPSMLNWSAGSPQPLNNYFQATHRKLRKGDTVVAEIEGRWGGYVGHYTLTGSIGPASSEYLAMFQLQQTVLKKVLEKVRPGVKVGELMTLAEEAGQGSEFDSRMILHGRGLGNDCPLVVFASRDDRMKNWVLEENSVLVIKPVVMTKDWMGKFFGGIGGGRPGGGPGGPGGPGGGGPGGPGGAGGGRPPGAPMGGHGGPPAAPSPGGPKSVCWGDSVVVTANGPQRLGKLAPKFYEFG